MKYVDEIKAFYDRLELNPLPSPAIALWHALMSIANKTGWQQEFTAAVSVLMLKSGLNAQAVKRARNRLEQEGYITWKTRGGNQAALYHLNSLVVQYDANFVPQSDPQSEPQTDPQSVPQSVPINRHRQKQDKDIPPISPVSRFEEFLSAYPKTGNRQAVETAYCRLLMDDAHLSEEDLIVAATNYADACRILKTKERYIKDPQNFLRDNFFMAYLGENYKKPKLPAGKQNQFNQFAQRDYDMDKLEERLLSR